MILVSSRPRLALVLAVLSMGSFGFVGCASAPPPPPPAASPVEEVEPKVEMASLEVLCNPPTDVAVDGTKIGTTPIKNHKITPGKHDVTFLDPDTGNRTMTVEVGPGEGKTVISDRPPNPNAAPSPKKK